MIKDQINYIILFLLFFASCSSKKSGWDQYLYSADVLKAQETIAEDLLSNHIAILSSDEFEGRKPATKGGRKTIEYLINEFEKSGLLPGNPNGKWTQ